MTELTRGQWLDPFATYDWVWRTDKGTHQTTVTITVLKDSLQLIYLGGAHRIHQPVRLTDSFGPRGGRRPWFRCPVCRRRIGVLYHGNGLPFRCRTCCKLAYPSQYNHEIKVTAVSTGESSRTGQTQPAGLSQLTEHRLNFFMFQEAVVDNVHSG